MAQDGSREQHNISPHALHLGVYVENICRAICPVEIHVHFCFVTPRDRRSEVDSPHVFFEQTADQVFGVLWDLIEGFIVKVPGSGGDIRQRLVIVITHKGRETAHPAREKPWVRHPEQI